MLVWIAAPLSGAEINNAAKKVIKKTGAVIGNAGGVLSEPIRNPRAAVRRWFDYDPRIESGEKKNFNILPLIVSSPERGFGFGLKFAEASFWRKSDVVRVQAVQTLKNKSSFEIKYELPPEMFAQAGGEILVSYENYTRFYYGVGNRTSADNKSEYTPEFLEFKLPLLFAVRDKLHLGLTLNYQNWKMVETGTSGTLRRDLPNLFGADTSRLWTTGLLLRWDDRDSRSDPTHGHYLETGFEYTDQLASPKQDYQRATVEYRFFHPLAPRSRQIIAARFYMNYKKGNTPFYVLPELGGIYFNRGLIEGRFRDTLSICGNLEYRLKIYKRLHWAFFVDAGNVYSNFSAVTPAYTKFTGGTGMRYYVPPGNLLLVRIDGGYSAEDFLVYLTFDHPF